jgi:hypothetical protein
MPPWSISLSLPIRDARTAITQLKNDAADRDTRLYRREKLGEDVRLERRVQAAERLAIEMLENMALATERDLGFDGWRFTGTADGHEKIANITASVVEDNSPPEDALMRGLDPNTGA